MKTNRKIPWVGDWTPAICIGCGLLTILVFGDTLITVLGAIILAVGIGLAIPLK